MHKVPDAVMTQYQTVLKRKVADVSRHADYNKWLRYFWDFCAKYPVPESKSERVRLFIEKLKAKKQTPDQQKQAAHAVSLFLERQRILGETISNPYQCRATAEGLPLQAAEETTTPVAPFVKGESRPDMRPHSVSKTEAGMTRQSSNSHYGEWRCLEKTGSPEWDKLIDKLVAEIKLRHYSRKTLKTYADWSRKFQGFLRNKPPVELSEAEVI